jgi:hypothetical protein
MTTEQETQKAPIVVFKVITFGQVTDSEAVGEALRFPTDIHWD